MIAALLVGLCLQQQSPFPNETVSTRLRAVLPNGATVVVDRTPGPQMAVSLVIASRGVEETYDRHGWRHLLEHLLARGKGGDLDARLEIQGSSLSAFTTRDAMTFSITGPKSEWQRGVASLWEIVKPDAFDAERIVREVKVMEQELALTEDARLFSEAAWKAAFGEAGLDPNGTVDSLARSTPEALTELQRAMVHPRNLVLHIMADVDLDDAVGFGSRYLGSLDRGPQVEWVDRPEFRSGRATVPAFGDARAALAPPFGTHRNLGVIAAGLALASNYGGAFFTYTPSSRPSVAIVGQTLDRVGITLSVDDAQAAELFRLGQILLPRWLERLEADAGTASSFRALAQHMDNLRLTEVIARAKALDFATFQAGLAAYSRESGIVVVGSR